MSKAWLKIAQISTLLWSYKSTMRFVTRESRGRVLEPEILGSNFFKVFFFVKVDGFRGVQLAKELEGRVVKRDCAMILEQMKVSSKFLAGKSRNF